MKMTSIEGSLYLLVFLFLIPHLAYGEDDANSTVTVKLQDPDTENMDDIWVDENAQDWNFDGPDLAVSSVEVGIDRVYIKFNISSIPDEENITDAQLYLYKYNDVLGATRNISAHHVTDRTWIESGLNWNAQVCGKNFDDSLNCNLTAEDTVAVNSTEGMWWNWNVTEMVKIEYDTENNDVSMALKDENERSVPYGLSSFRSKEYTKPTLRPYLLVSHTDTKLPQIIIDSPKNTTYNTSAVDLNYSVIEANLGWVGYSLDGADNVTTKGVITTFSDGSSSKNITFSSAGSDASTYIKVPKNATVISATMSVSGYDAWSDYNNTTLNYSHDEVANSDAIDDQNWSTYTTGTNISGPDYIFENYYIYDDVTELNYYFKVREMNTSEDENISVSFYWNDWEPYLSVWDVVWTSNSTGTQYANITASNTLPGGSYVNEDGIAQVEITIPTFYPNLSEYDYFYEGKMRYKGNPTNVSIDTGNDTIIDWLYTEFPELNPSNSPQEVDLNTTAINDYISANSADVQGYVSIPIKIYSGSTGTVELSSLSLDYYSNTTLTGLPNGQHYVTVYASDTSGNLNSSTVYFTVNANPQNITSFNISLIPGWNMISIPLEQDNWSIPWVLNSIWGNYTDIYAYVNGMWYWDTSLLPFFKLTDMAIENGYWINMSTEETLELNGTVPSSTTISVVPKWNLVGYPSFATQNITTVLSPIGYTDVYTYKSGMWYWDTSLLPFFVLTEMTTGQGYWINATGSGSYDV